MTIITKAGLAAELKVTKARVSQYVKSGLPVRADGKLDREACLDWIGKNLRSGASHEKGPSRARALAPPRPTLNSATSGAVVRQAREQMARDVVYGVMCTACDLELPMKVVFALAMNMQWYCSDLLTDGPFRGAPLSLDPEAVCPDWGSVADGQDEPYDLDAWEAYRAEMYERAS